MGVGITIKNVYVPDITKDRLESRLADIERYIGIIKGQMIALAASSPYPTAYTNGEPMEWADYIANKTQELMDGLVEYETERFLLTYAIENINDVVE